MRTPGKFYVNTVMRLEATFENDDGTAVDPDTVKFRTYAPSGATATYTYGDDDEVQRESTGNYTADITPDEAGRWHYRWETTGTGTTIALESDFLIQESAFFDPPGHNYGYWYR